MAIDLSAGRAIGFTGATSQETRTTVDGPALRGIERDGGLLSTLRALNRNLHALSHAGGLGSSDCR